MSSFAYFCLNRTEAGREMEMPQCLLTSEYASKGSGGKSGKREWSKGYPIIWEKRGVWNRVYSAKSKQRFHLSAMSYKFYAVLQTFYVWLGLLPLVFSIPFAIQRCNRTLELVLTHGDLRPTIAVVRFSRWAQGLLPEAVFVPQVLGGIFTLLILYYILVCLF